MKINHLKEVGVKNIATICLRKILFVLKDVVTIARGTFRDELLYVGFVGHKNLGDEILFDAHKALFPSVKFAHLNYLSSVRIANIIRRPFYKYSVLGGGTLIDHSTNWVTFVEVLQQYETRLFCIGTGVEDTRYWSEKIDKNAHMRRWVDVLKNFLYIGVRGPISEAILKENGLEVVDVIGDTALALYSESLKNLNDKKKSLTIGLTFGITPGQTQWGNKQTYATNIETLVKRLVEMGHEVVLLPIWDLDLKSNKELIDKVDSDKLVLKVANNSYSEFTDEIKRCDIFIGQKLHGTIMSYMSGVPALMIEYQPKCRDFMRSIDQEKYTIKTDALNIDQFMPLFDQLSSSLAAIQKLSTEKISQYKEAQHRAAANIMSHLKKN